MMLAYIDLKTEVFRLAKEAGENGAKIWNAIRYADDFRDSAIRKLYFDDGDALNVWFIFLSLRSPNYNNNGILLSIDYTFTFMGIHSVIDQKREGGNSTDAVENQIMAFASKYESDIELGFDPGVSHTGFRARIIGGLQLAYQAHLIDGSLTVRTEDC